MGTINVRCTEWNARINAKRPHDEDVSFVFVEDVPTAA
jgi:hypothetical protein